MSSNHYANGANCVSIDFVKSICPKEWEEFNQQMSEADISFNDVCESMAHHSQLPSEIINGNHEEILSEALDVMVKKFNTITSLELEFVYFNASERGDELDGGSFSVDGVYGLTEAGKKYINDIKYKSWCEFG